MHVDTSVAHNYVYSDCIYYVYFQMYYTCKERSHVSMNLFLNFSAMELKLLLSNDVSMKLDAILYTPMVGHSIQYFVQATISLYGALFLGPHRSTVNLYICIDTRI